MKKQSRRQEVTLVKTVSASVAEAVRQAEIIHRELEIDALDLHIAGLPLDIGRAARKAMRVYGLTVDEASVAAKEEARKRRDRIAREDAERRRAYQFESEKSRAEKAFSESLERVNSAIENESDPFMRSFLINAIPDMPKILEDGSVPVKVRKEKTEKTTTKTPKTENRKELLEKALPGTIEEISAKTGVDKLTVSKYVTAYTKDGKGWSRNGKVISLA